MLPLALIVVSIVGALAALDAREEVNFDFAYRFHLGDDPDHYHPPAPSPPQPPIPACSDPHKGFPVNKSGVQCGGLKKDNNAKSLDDCRKNCCGNQKCDLWQWSDDTSEHGGCWSGSGGQTCQKNSHWVGGAKQEKPHPPPAPSPMPFNKNVTLPTYDDSAWNIVDAPHDMIIGGVYNQETSGSGQSYLPRSNGVYRKHFNIPEDYEGSSVWLAWEGVWQSCEMWLNGQPLPEGNRSGTGVGYTGFTTRLDNVTSVKYGTGKTRENVLVVYVKALSGTGWWYEGGGIYRHVKLVAAPRVHIETDGVFAPGKVTGKVIAKGSAPTDGYQTDKAEVDAGVTVVNDGVKAALFSVRFDILDEQKKQVATLTTKNSKVNAQGKMTVPSSGIALESAQLWSVPRPYLYTVRTTVLVDGTASDSVDTSIGIYTTEWTGDHGLYMNGKHVKVRGFCDHNDFGGVGMAVHDRIKLYRAQSLRSVGGNGRRMSHNPPDPATLDIYDRLGVVVMDENRIFSDDALHVMNMGAMVKRDRNHPSVVIYSYCNEGGCDPAHGDGFRAITEKLDGTRPTLGNHHGNKFMDANTDVEGFSHNPRAKFVAFHATENTTKPTFASECCSCISNVRGEDFQANCIAEQTNYSNGIDFVSGTMVWTLFDYYGESHGWPHVSSQYGSFDLAGFEKGGAWWYRSWWLDDVPPSSDDRPAGYASPTHTCRIWNDRWDGNITSNDIHVVTALPMAELFVDSQSLGVVNVSKLGYGTWQPKFKQGSTLKAVCHSSDKRTAITHEIQTPGAAASLRLSLDAPNEQKGTGSSILLDGQDIALIRAEVLDKQGNLVTTSTANVTFSVSGPGRIIASHNGDPACHTPNLAAWHEAFHGLARGVMQVTMDAATPSEHRGRLLEIDSDGGQRTQILDPKSDMQVPPVLTVTATSPGLTTINKLTIPVSVDMWHDSVLAAATRSLENVQKWAGSSQEESVLSYV